MTRLRFLGVAHRNTTGEQDTAAGVYGIDPDSDDCPNCPAGQMPYGAQQCGNCDDADHEAARTCRNCGLVEDHPNHNGLCRDCDHDADYVGGHIQRRTA